jgi:hypothetical protein
MRRQEQVVCHEEFVLGALRGELPAQEIHTELQVLIETAG